MLVHVILVGRLEHSSLLRVYVLWAYEQRNGRSGVDWTLVTELDGRGRPSLRALRLPPQHWLARRCGLIQTRDARVVRGVEHELRIFFHLFRDRFHGLDEEIQFFFWLAL